MMQAKLRWQNFLVCQDTLQYRNKIAHNFYFFLEIKTEICSYIFSSAIKCRSSSWKTKRGTIISQNVSVFFLQYSLFPWVSYLKKSSRQINTKGENVQALELGKTHSILLVGVNDVSEKTGLSQVEMRLRLAWWYVDLCPVLCETSHSPVERESTELINLLS